MSLDFDYKNVAKRYSCIIAPHDRPGDYKAGETIYHPVMNTVIWRLMALGVTRITSENYKEVYLRNCLYEALFPDTVMRVPSELIETESGSIISPTFIPLHLTEDDFFHLIGLSTNVSFETGPAWRKRITAQFMEEAERSAPRKNKSVYKHYEDVLPERCIIKGEE